SETSQRPLTCGLATNVPFRLCTRITTRTCIAWLRGRRFSPSCRHLMSCFSTN
ncbi:unnamed protein product, partial [Ascophyllum nodosum]